MRIEFRWGVGAVVFGTFLVGVTVSGQGLTPDSRAKGPPQLSTTERRSYIDHTETDQTPNKIDPDRWADLVDAAWGQGPPTIEKLQVFDEAWTELDERYGAFMNLEVDLAVLRDRYRLEILNGVSQGRFAAILNYLSFAMKDAHTAIMHREVNWNTEPQPGVPLFIVSAWLGTWHFGASLTPLPDDTLLVIRVLPDHPLGLEVGDIVLGYEGVPWNELYRLLLEAELPIGLTWVWGSTDEAMEHCLLMSAGLNWHLFETIDIVKYTTGETIHLPTAPLEGQFGEIIGNEQLPVPGVPMYDLFVGDAITWGIVEGTNIGFIYVASWSWEPEDRISEQFAEAIYSLMFEHETNGLIIDMRLNTGGSMLEAHQGYSLLFDTSIAAVSFDVRGDPSDHLDMVPHPTYDAELFTIPGNPGSYYDKPIAVLVGPGTVSNGDWETVRLGLHPKARVFGKPTNGAFTPSDFPDLGGDWYFTKATGSGYLIEGHRYLAHTSAPIDEEVWLTQEDVVQGRDTVVEAAIAWIEWPAPRQGSGRSSP
ncbi:MAG: hypothetical protein KAJ78_01125 [Acidobacteria bacterium]|nr:hypothetical protein [Acidobacteriota bacterium]